jgi:excisionase family DNA binding protein
MNNAQNLLTVEMAAEYLHCHPETVRRMIRRGELKAIKFRHFWRVPLEVLRRVENVVLDAPAHTPNKSTPAASDTGQNFTEELDAMREKHTTAILAGLTSDDPHRRNAAILALSQADAQTRALVEAEVAHGMAEYSGAEDDWSDWRALDAEPFHFPEETRTEEVTA